MWHFKFNDMAILEIPIQFNLFLIFLICFDITYFL